MSLPPSWTKALDNDNTEDDGDDLIQPPPTYCICKQPDDGNKMIRCNDCKEWFHSRCVNLTHSQVAKYEKIHKKWHCPVCLGKNQTQQGNRIPCPFSPDRTFKNEKTLDTHMKKQHPNCSANNPEEKNTVDLLMENLIKAKTGCKILRRIPKGARFSVADKFSKIVEDCIQLNTVESWSNLLLFAYRTMHVETGQKKSLTTKIKENIAQTNLAGSLGSTYEETKKTRLTTSLEQLIQTRMDDYDIRGAIKLLSSNDKLAPFDEATFEQLLTKHPRSNKVVETTETVQLQQVAFTETCVRKAINSFPCGSAPGVDGFRPQFLKDVISVSAGAAGEKALTSITLLCNFLSEGKLNAEIVPILYGASLCALSKNDGGIRPIAVGSVFRRLIAKLSCRSVQSDLQNHLWPNQLGVATRLGCETVIHTVRTYVNSDANKTKILLKIDFANAFNSVDRQAMMTQVAAKAPSLTSFLSQCYQKPSCLFFGQRQISSEVGCQQGDPCGPMTFCLSIHPIVQSLTSELNLWYLDDATLADSEDIVFEDFCTLIGLAKEIGLSINPSKCELFFCSNMVNDEIVEKFDAISPGIKIVTKDNLEILGTPIFEEAFQPHAEKKMDQLKILTERLVNLEPHTAYFLLKNCLFIPKLTYFLRTSPFFKFPNIMSNMDAYLHDSLENILNIPISEQEWIQATLPINDGGLGIRKISDIALPAFLASAYGCHDLISKILSNKEEITVHLLDEALECWKQANDDIVTPIPEVQHNWDMINIKKIIQDKLDFSVEEEKARFAAVRRKEAGAWLQALPSKNVGTLMDGQDFQTCIGLRLGCSMFQSHYCDCGKIVNEKGRHGLSCKKCKGRWSRHSELNKIIQHALATARIPASLEPVGLFRDDGKRPDGVTLVPWAKGQRLVWDVTCVDTLAASHLQITASEAGGGAEVACKKKHEKYASIKSSNFLFKGLAFETLGPWCEESLSFIDQIGKLLIKESGDIKAKHYLYQRISLAIQRGNAASIRGTMPDSISMEEIHNL